MTSSKNTKRVLFASVLSMMLCAAMLIGSTFAWFTDSVTSDKNKIVAGNLDVELEYRTDPTDETSWTKVTETTNMFKEGALWEPGHVEVINLKISNRGTLALKYQFGLNIASEKPGTNLANDSFLLSDHILYTLLDGEKTFSADSAGRAQAIEAAEAAGSRKLSALSIDKTGILYPTEKASPEYPSEKTVTLIVYMPADVGNIANYKAGTEAPEIELGIKLVAGQTPYEWDSFDDQYDASAWEEMDPLRADLVSATTAEQDMGVVTFDTEDSKLMQFYRQKGIAPNSLSTFIFSVTGRTSKAVQMTFDFEEKCKEGGTYKDILFEGGFGGHEDIYLPAGTYEDYCTAVKGDVFTLVGDYYPFVFTVTPGEGNQNKFSYKGSLAGLIQALSDTEFMLEPGEYNDTFTVTVEWPLETPGTEACHVIKDGTREPLMDCADTHWGGSYGEGWPGDLWADFEVMFQKRS